MKKMLTVIIVGALFFGGCSSKIVKMKPTWIKDQNGCKIWNSSPIQNETITWSGECVNGYASDYGKLQWYTDGIATSKYIGTMKKGKYHGQGISTGINQVKFIGTWENGIKNGKGISYFKNGDKWIGLWKNGRSVKQLDISNSLTWIDPPKRSREATWDDAYNICKSINARVPSITELKRIITNCGGVITIRNKKNQEKNIENEYYQACYKAKGFTSENLGYSSSTTKGMSSAWFVNFKYGTPFWTNPLVYQHNGNNLYGLMCVSGKKTSTNNGGGLLGYFLAMTAKALLTKSPPSKHMVFTRLCVSTNQGNPVQLSVKKSTVKVTGVSTSYNENSSDSTYFNQIDGDENCFNNIATNNTYNISSYGIDNRGKPYSFSSEISINTGKSEETYCHILLDDNKIECKNGKY